MKFNEYLNSLRKEDPGFDKWFKKNWIAWNPPKRKVGIFLDRNLSQMLKNELIDFPKFKAFEEIKYSSREDSDIYDYCSRKNYLILTNDNDFWNDRKFPLSKSPGVIILATSLNTYDCEAALAYFLTYFDLLGGIRRFPDFARKMKFRISKKGFSHKYITYKNKIEKLQIEY